MRDTKCAALLVVLLGAVAGGASCVNNGPNSPGPQNPSTVSWDFEDPGLVGWQADGDAFSVSGGQPHARFGFSPARPMIGGSYYRGSRDIGAHGGFLIATGDAPQGALSSTEFTLQTNHTFISALIGGSNDANVFVAMQIRTSDWDANHGSTEARPGPVDGDYLTVARGSGTGDDAMVRKVFDLTPYLGYHARVKIVDQSATGHINVDYVRFEAQAPPAQQAPVWGFADLHSHQFANLAFGGAFFTGKPFDPTCTPASGCALMCPAGASAGAACQMARSLPNCDYLPGGDFDSGKAVNAIVHGNAAAGAILPVFGTAIATTAGSAALLLGAAAPVLGLGVVIALSDPLFGPPAATLLATGTAVLATVGAGVSTIGATGLFAIQPILAICTTGNGLAHGPMGCSNVAGEVMENESLHHIDGFPSFTDWPRFRTMTHQQMYWEWLKRSWQGGMRVMVMDAVDNELLCRLENVLKGTMNDCTEMTSVDAQIQGAKDLEMFIAQNDGGWYKIVHNSAEARAAVEAGQLAVVLGIETDSLFGCAKTNCGLPPGAATAWIHQQLDRYQAMGVVKLNPIHLSDNEFGGMALYSSFFGINSQILTNRPLDVRDCSPSGIDFTLASIDPVFTNLIALVPGMPALQLSYGGAAHCNNRGLTPLGKTLIQEMITRKMLIDVDHMSLYSTIDTLVATGPVNYPVLGSHSGLNSMEALPGHSTERDKSLAALAKLRETGSMLGLGVSAASGKTHPSGPAACDRSAATFANIYMAAVDAMGGTPFALGSDLNGLNEMAGPRFGPDACYGAPAPQRASQIAAQAGLPMVGYAPAAGGATNPDLLAPSVAGRVVFNVNTDGMAHVGMYPDWLQDVSNTMTTVGAQNYMVPIFRSAESFVRLWEQIDGTRPRGGDSLTDDF